MKLRIDALPAVELTGDKTIIAKNYRQPRLKRTFEADQAHFGCRWAGITIF
jgi:hypothetical protein